MQPLGKTFDKLRSKMIASGRMIPTPEGEPEIDPYADIEPLDGGPRCDSCLGTRWVRLDPSDMDRRDPRLGKALRCKACAPYFEQKRIDKLTGSLPRAFQGFTLDSFPKVNTIDVVGMLLEWAGDLAKPWLYMYSNAHLDSRSGRMVYASGRGKTGLAVGLSKHLAAQDKTVAFVYVPDLIQRLKDGFRNPDDAYGSDMIMIARESEVLVLDDLGAGRASEWANKDVIMPLITSRHANDLQTIITSNLSPSELVDYFEHDRAVTRIEERCTSESGFWVLDMTDMVDLRLGKQKTQQAEAF